MIFLKNLFLLFSFFKIFASNYYFLFQNIENVLFITNINGIYKKEIVFQL